VDYEFQTIDHSKLGEIVYQHIAGALTKGALKPGERLKIRDLAHEMGTSVTPVRDAILRLVHEGALLLKSPRDIRVPVLHQDRYLEIRTIRLKLEGLAAERAASNASAADIARLERLIDDNESVLSRIRAGHGKQPDLPFRTREHRRHAGSAGHIAEPLASDGPGDRRGL
jgi:DNA-binding GntR family transcriptional regulator